MTEQKKTSPWMWIGCGCGLVLLAIGLAVGGAGFFAVKKAKEFGESMTDPVAREQKVIEILGGDGLPPGFHAMFGFSIPWVMDIALLSDLPPDEDDPEPQDFGDAGMIYVQIRSGMGTDLDELRDYFEGRTDDVAILRDNDIDIDVDEVIDRGKIDRDDLDLWWVSHRGDVRAMGNRSGNAIVAMMMLDCPGDEKLRMAIWFENDDQADVATGTADFTGTPADPSEIRTFSEYLRPCPN